MRGSYFERCKFCYFILEVQIAETFLLKLLKKRGKYMYHLLYQSIKLHFVFVGVV
jgi:hypothetical protein